MTFLSILNISIQKKTACSASSPFPLTQPAVSLYTGIPPKLFNLYLQNSSPITHAFNWVGVQSNQLKTWRNLSPPLTPDVCTSTRVVNIFNTPRSILSVVTSRGLHGMRSAGAIKTKVEPHAEDPQRSSRYHINQINRQSCITNI